MQKNLSLALAFAGLLVAVTSCNIYSPFSASTGEQGFLDEGQACLHEGDYDCAIENFNQLSAGTTKKKKLCTAYLGRAGITLNVLLNVVTQSNTTMMGALANELVPWSAQKQQDAEAARTVCADYGDDTGTDDTGVMLSTLGYLVDCGMRLAKTDQLRGASLADTACTTVGDQSGTVTKDDINSDGSGDGTAMCVSDVTQCTNDINEVDAGTAGSAGLSGISAALSALPGGVTNADTTVARVALEATIQ